MKYKTGEFFTLLKSYRGLIGNMQIGDMWITFDCAYYNYFSDEDEIQFLLAGQQGVVSIHHILGYEKLPEDDLYDDTVAGYAIHMENGHQLDVFMFPRP